MTAPCAAILPCFALLQVSAVLLPPRNLTISSENFKHILTWEDPNNESTIFYQVNYLPMYQAPPRVTKHCSNVTTRRCELSEDLTDVNSHYDITVLSFTNDESSEPSSRVSLTPIEDTVLGPPIVDVVPGDRLIKVSIQLPASHLWSDENQRYVSLISDEGFSELHCHIKMEHMTEVSFYKEDMHTENCTFIQSNLLPNANYCLSVNITSNLNKKPPVPSKLKCVVTEYHGGSTVHVIVSAVCGVLLFIGLVFCLIGLDFAGYICRAKTAIPKVLKSLPSSESSFVARSEFTSPTFSIPVDIISKKFQVEPKPESEKNCEEGYTSRKRLVDSDTSGTSTSGDLPSAVSSSTGSSGEANSSAEEDLSSGRRGDRVSSSVSALGGSSIVCPPVSVRDDSSNLPFDTSGVFNINLNTVSIADPAEVWSGFRHVEVPQEEAEVSVESHETEIELDQCNGDICLSIDGLEEEDWGDCEEVEDISENDDSDSNLISGYMKR
ncbi:interferon alpha/beta receptor 2-like isoform X2 [Bufo gargarizans]|uniref:interferon alpha/beta receptor 2-like isoform X2 n=1 Tax=Bufo gargarizans TaxID=30331 RepID=UPI001CF505CB|nr:interferon alpha/beta receptor 2-like isoform X2 [Bufo gargarizans]XP_044140352.1 interferon alpha/beta receptor 2-like isoform X2 [Bufo gargarizans]